ncbi:MAG: GtrA family protein [Thermoleophilia bacterium]
MPTRPSPPVSVPGVRVLRLPDLRRVGREDWHQLVRFCLVGTSGYVINLAVFALLLHGAGAHYILAAIGAFCVAWTSNFLFNKFWTFRRHELSALNQGARYLAVSLVALGLNLVVLELLVSAGAPEVLAQAIAIAAVMPVNFLLNRRWSFR